MSQNAKIRLGGFIQNRGELRLIADGGTIAIGDHCFFNSNCCITSMANISIGNRCKVGNNVVIIDHDHDYKAADREGFVSTPISIGDNVWIGANSTILRGAVLGDNVVVGAGTVVKGTIPANSLVYSSTRNNVQEIQNA